MNSPILIVVKDGDMVKHKNLLAIKLGENDYLPIEIGFGHMVIPEVTKRGNISLPMKIVPGGLDKEVVEVLVDGIAVPSNALFI